MRKIPIFISSILICTLLNITYSSNLDASAKGVFEGRNFWTAEDFLAYEAEFERGRYEACGENLDCRQEYLREYAKNDRVHYNMLNIFNIANIVIDSINPSEGTMKIMYRGQSAGEKIDGEILEKPNPLKSLYMVWLDDFVADPFEDMSWLDPAKGHFSPYYVDEFLSGEFKPGTHPVYRYEENNEDPFPADTIVEVPIRQDSEIEFNEGAQIYYTFRIGGLSSHSMHSYNFCVNHPLYREGMTCKYAIDEYYNQFYVPFTADGEIASELTVSSSVSEPELEPELKNESESEPELEPEPVLERSIFGLEPELGPELEPELEPESEPEPELNHELNSELELESEPKNEPKLKSQPGAILAPNTGAITGGDSTNHKDIVFPWWLGVLLGLNGLILLWLFLPIDKKTPKNSKKLQKKY